MSEDLISWEEGLGFSLTRYACPNKTIRYQITTNRDWITISKEGAIRLLEALEREFRNV